jgi:hypothetical protein
MRPDIAPGGTLPDFELPDHTKTPRRLNELQGEDRLNPPDLWHDLRTVTSEIRPDWELSTPGLRGLWDAGDFSAFHGWNKRAGEKPAAV